jgi:ATP-dependent RNA helicase DeaD
VCSSDLEKGREKEWEKRTSGKGTGRFSEKGYARLFINLGRTDGLAPQNVIGLLNDNIPGKKVDIGRIDLMKNFSFFEVKEADKERVIRNLDGIKVFGRRVAVEGAQPSPSDNRKEKIERSHKENRKENRKENYKSKNKKTKKS